MYPFYSSFYRLALTLLFFLPRQSHSSAVPGLSEGQLLTLTTLVATAVCKIQWYRLNTYSCTLEHRHTPPDSGSLTASAKGLAALVAHLLEQSKAPVVTAQSTSQYQVTSLFFCLFYTLLPVLLVGFFLLFFFLNSFLHSPHHGQAWPYILPRS